MNESTYHRELLDRTADLLAQATSVELFIPEETALFSINSEHVTQIRSLIPPTIELLRDASNRFEELASSLSESESSTDTEDSVLLEIGALISSEIAAQEVSDLAFVARGQLIEIQEALENAVTRKQVWVVASHTDSGLRRVHKALISLESAIYEFEGESAPERQWTDLDDSLEIRRLYGQFRRAVLRGDLEASGKALKDQLKSASRRIAILRDLKIYPFLRIDDRLTIRQLHRRICSWSQSTAASKDEDGRRIWQDLVSFARLLSKINEREELREHDRRTIQRLLTLGSRQDQSGPLNDSQQKEVETLLGCDDDLDLVILKPGPRALADLFPLLNRLRETLLPESAPWANETLPPLATP